MATLIRDHGLVEQAASSTTITQTLGYDVPAGRVLLAIVGSEGGADPVGLSKPIGETAAWSKLADTTWTFPGGDTRGRITVWAVKTEIKWFATQTIAVTWSSARTHRTFAMSEWVGLKAERLGSASYDSTNGSRNPPNLNVATATDVQPGDLVLTTGSMYTGNYQPSFNLSAQGGTATLESTPSWTGTARPGVFPNYWLMAPWRASLVTGAGNRSATWTTSHGLPATGFPAAALMIAIPADDYPPYAPTLTSMTGGVAVDRNRILRFAWTFSSPNAIDAQSKYDFRYRLVGTGTWTTVTQSSVNSFRDVAGGTFAAGDYEWQVRTYGALGKESPWSESGFFTASDPPPGATITYPLEGQSVDQVETVIWSVPAQDAYQFRRLGDNPASPGTPDPTVVYYDSGEVADATTRALPVSFAVNSRVEHLQVRVKDDGLWQEEWDSVQVAVSYAPPPTPTWDLYVDEGTATMLIEIANPAPVGDDPAAVYNDIYVNDGGGWERRATGLPTNGSWRFWMPKSGRDYSTSIRVVAVAANGTTSTSA